MVERIDWASGLYVRSGSMLFSTSRKSLHPAIDVFIDHDDALGEHGLPSDQMAFITLRACPDRTCEWKPASGCGTRLQWADDVNQFGDGQLHHGRKIRSTALPSRHLLAAACRLRSSRRSDLFCGHAVT